MATKYYPAPDETPEFMAHRSRLAGLPYDDAAVRQSIRMACWARSKNAGLWRDRADLCRRAGFDATAADCDATAVALQHRPAPDPSTGDTP